MADRPESELISRREALRTAAAVAGTAAFATPVVVGVFASPARAVGEGTICNPDVESDTILATGYEGVDWNHNCNSGGPLGSWNGQDTNFTFVDGGVNQVGTVRVGAAGTDATDLQVQIAYYTIVSPTGFECSAYWRLLDNPYKVPQNYVPVNKTVLSSPVNPATLPLPYPNPGAPDNYVCQPDTAAWRLKLASVYCCPL